MYGIPLPNRNKEEEENYRATEVLRRSLAFCPCSAAARTIQQNDACYHHSELRPACIPAARHTIRPFCPQKGQDSCCFLHSALSVMLTHSPRPRTHTGKGKHGQTGCAHWLLQRHPGSAFRAVCLAMFNITSGDILHICNIFINNNNSKINERIMTSLKEEV